MEVKDSVKYLARPAWRQIILSNALVPGFALIGIFAATTYLSIDLPFRLALGLTALMGIVLSVIMFFKRYMWLFKIENNEINSMSGIKFLTKLKSETVHLDDVLKTEAEQTVLQTAVTTGDVFVYTAGSGTSDIVFRGVHRPYIVRDFIRHLVDENKKGKCDDSTSIERFLH